MTFEYIWGLWGGVLGGVFGEVFGVFGEVFGVFGNSLEIYFYFARLVNERLDCLAVLFGSYYCLAIFFNAELAETAESF